MGSYGAGPMENKLLEPNTLELFFEPKDRLRLTVGDRSYHTVKPAWAAPLSHPNKYLALLDGKGNEITTVAEPKDLSDESWNAVKDEIKRRYLTARVIRITHAKQEFGATYWSMDTDRGHRELVTQNLQENAVWLSEHHLLLLDVDGNRFELENVAELDAESRHFLDTIL